VSAETKRKKTHCTKCPTRHRIPDNPGTHGGCKRNVPNVQSMPAHGGTPKPHPNAKRLAVRQAEHDDSLKRGKGSSSENTHRPGSLNRKKTIRVADQQRANRRK
jgi:hypothetical protein